MAFTEDQYQVPNISSNGYLVPISSHQYNYIEPQKQDGSLSPSGDDLNEFSDHEDDNIPYQCKCLSVPLKIAEHEIAVRHLTFSDHFWC